MRCSDTKRRQPAKPLKGLARNLRRVIPPARLAEISEGLRPYATRADRGSSPRPTGPAEDYLAVEALLQQGWGTSAWPLTSGLLCLGYTEDETKGVLAGLLRARLLDYARGRAVLTTLGDWVRRGPAAAWVAERLDRASRASEPCASTTPRPLLKSTPPKGQS